MLWYALKHPISIHALREEGDLLASAALSTASNFYPRPPRGGRLSASTAARCLPEFLSTPSARRATSAGLYCRLLLYISIHALREEGDLLWEHWKEFMGISIHALREEGDCSA